MAERTRRATDLKTDAAKSAPTPTPAPGITKVEVSSSEPPPQPHRRVWDTTPQAKTAMAFRWLFAPLVEHWRGLSLTRFMAGALLYVTWDIAHDWLRAQPSSIALSWAFVAFVLSGLFLAVVTALGAKYVDRIITLVGAKLGVALVNPPLPPSL